MKKLAAIFCVISFSAIVFAGELDGKNFCRSVETSGPFGEPPVKRDHCVSFKDDVMTDNDNTFFGSPPSRLNYVLVGSKILVVEGGKLMSTYSYDEAGDRIANGLGAILTVK